MIHCADQFDIPSLEDDRGPRDDEEAVDADLPLGPPGLDDEPVDEESQIVGMITCQAIRETFIQSGTGVGPGRPP